MTLAGKWEILDKTGTVLGEFEITEIRSGAYCGTFRPTEEFSAVRPLFEEFASVVEQQAFHSIDALYDQIHALALRGRQGEITIPVFDLQLYSEGGSFRTLPLSPDNRSIND